MLATKIEVHLGKKLRIARLGAGPPLILLHGYPDNLQIWCELAPLLAHHFEVIAFDWPGLGNSEGWPGGASPFDMAHRLLALLDAWCLDRAALIGHDMGGQPALALAAQHPSRVSHIVVMNSLVIWDEQTSWEIDLLRRFGWNRVLLKYFARVVYQRALHTFLPRGFAIPQDLDRDLWSSFQRPEVRQFVIRMCAGYQGTLKKLAELYPAVQVPSLFLWAEHDKHFPIAHARKLASLVPGARLEQVDQAQHWMGLYRAPDLASRILRFLKPQASD